MNIKSRYFAIGCMLFCAHQPTPSNALITEMCVIGTALSCLSAFGWLKVFKRLPKSQASKHLHKNPKGDTSADSSLTALRVFLVVSPIFDVIAAPIPGVLPGLYYNYRLRNLLGEQFSEVDCEISCASDDEIIHAAGMSYAHIISALVMFGCAVWAADIEYRQGRNLAKELRGFVRDVR